MKRCAVTTTGTMVRARRGMICDSTAMSSPCMRSMCRTYTFDGDLTGANARLAIAGHVLAQASLTGTYTLNPRVQRG